ncbi:MAG: gamma-glutamyltransferase [Gammaproteobacteria bacterium]|nr:gamma-glutamyltransferase [Gammaproteobacteria bacterium]
MLINTGRPVTMAPRAMVVSAHALASEAGVAILQAGGHAVDAAIATSAALAVLYPHMTGVGGDAFWLIHDGATGAISYLNAAGQAAASASMEWFQAAGMDAVPLRGVLPATLTVPGAVDGWCTAHDRFGRLPLARVLAAAAGYARDGFPVTARLAHHIGACAGDHVFNGAAATIFLPAGAPPMPGTRLTNPALAATLEGIGEGGRQAFYEGPIAAALTRFSATEGGFFAEDDFAAQHSYWGKPLSGQYRGVTIYETPPPTQGFAVLEMLNLLEGFDIGSWRHLGVDHVHHLVQAKQIAYNDRDRLLADPRFATVPVEQLLHPDYALSRRSLLDSARAIPWDQVPSYGSLNGNTVFTGVVDDEGNAVALIQSLYGIFGSGVVADGTGIVLQNRSAYFSLDPEHPNHLEAGKRPAHTLIASMAKRDSRLWQVLGCMGADGQPQIHVQAYINLIDFGLDIQQAVEAPRWLSGRFALGEPRDLLNIEGRFDTDTLNALEGRGHQLNRWPAFEELAGHCHGITLDPVSNIRLGGADPRSDGAAIGY